MGCNLVAEFVVGSLEGRAAVYTHCIATACSAVTEGVGQRLLDRQDHTCNNISDVHRCDVESSLQLQHLLNAAACLVSETRKSDRGLSQLMHVHLHCRSE